MLAFTMALISSGRSICATPCQTAIGQLYSKKKKRKRNRKEEGGAYLFKGLFNDFGSYLSRNITNAVNPRIDSSLSLLLLCYT